MLTQVRLRELLNYDPNTGIFQWRVDRWRIKAGETAGCLKTAGYVYIRVDGGQYLASRLAWLYMTGEWPVNTIDHRNGDTADNRWDNLRAADHSQQNANRRGRVDSLSGVKGVRYDARVGRWRARIKKNGKEQSLGSFATAADAQAAYARRARELHGEFVRNS
jgi:hypothetical protein